MFQIAENWATLNFAFGWPWAQVASSLRCCAAGDKCYRKACLLSAYSQRFHTFDSKHFVMTFAIFFEAISKLMHFGSAFVASN